MKESTHEVGKFLQMAQSTNEHPRQLDLVLRNPLGHTPLDVVPNLFVRIELRRLRRQEKQFQPAFLCGNEIPHQLRLVRGGVHPR